MDDIVGTPLLDGHVQSRQNQLFAEMGRHRQPHDLATPDVHHDRQIEEAGPGRNVGDVRHPQLI
jgi:hypothetical protein